MDIRSEYNITAPRFWPISTPSVAHWAAHGHNMEANGAAISAHFPLSSSSRKWRQSVASQSRRRTPNSLKVNETYKRGAPAIHLNPQSNLLSQQRQTSPCAPSAVLGITNYGIFCPAYVLPCRHVRRDGLLRWDLSNLENAKMVFCRGEFCNPYLSEFNAFTLHHTACQGNGGDRYAISTFMRITDIQIMCSF